LWTILAMLPFIVAMLMVMGATFAAIFA